MSEEPTLIDLAEKLDDVKRAALNLRLAIAQYRADRALARLGQAESLASQAPVTTVTN